MTRPGWLIADFDYRFKMKQICYVIRIEKVISFQDIAFFYILYDCGKKISTASSLRFAPSRSQSSTCDKTQKNVPEYS